MPSRWTCVWTLARGELGEVAATATGALAAAASTTAPATIRLRMILVLRVLIAGPPSRSTLASETGKEVVEDAFRIHGGYGYSKEYEIERLFREAPFLLIGEGTSEIQKTIISRGLLRDYVAK